jgi:hypothetical protein
MIERQGMERSLQSLVAKPPVVMMANTLIGHSPSDGTATQPQVGTITSLLGCVNCETVALTGDGRSVS